MNRMGLRAFNISLKSKAFKVCNILRHSQVIRDEKFTSIDQ